MKHNLTDLNAYLFEQVERLSNDEISEEELEKEISRTKAMTDVAGKIIDTGQLALEGRKLVKDSMDADIKVPKMLE